MRRLVAFVCVFAATHSGADTIADVEMAVRRLAAKQPVKATFAIDYLVKTSGRFANDTSTRAATAEVGHDRNGVSILIPQSLLDKAAQQTRKGEDDAAQSLIGSIRSTSIVEALDFRDTLLAMLDTATVREERRVAFQGRPTTLLVLKLNPRPRKESNTIRIGSLKSEEELSLWVGDDHLPLAAVRLQKSTAGFLFLHGTMTTRTKYTFAVAADRLILARVESNDSGSGLGQNVDRTSVQTVTVHVIVAAEKGNSG